MSGPDQPAQPYRQQDGGPDDSETTVVDARALGADPSAPASTGDVPQAWSRTAEESAPTTATPYPRAYRPVDDDDPTDAPLADTPGTFGGAPVPESADVRPVSPYAAPATAATPVETSAAAPSSTAPSYPAPSPTEPDQVEPENDEARASAPTVTTSREELARASQPADAPGATSAYQPFQSTAVPAVAPFPSGGARTDGGSGTAAASLGDDATRALPRSGDTQAGGAHTSDPKDVFDRPYPAGPQPLAQPEYIPPPQPQPGMLDERDTFIGQPARPDEPDLLPEKRRIWQNLLGALIGLLLVLGPIIGFALLAGTPDSLFDVQLARRFLVLGIIVVAAVPALLAGWAPATAWFTGGILAVVGTIAFLSSSFTNQLLRWSKSLFDTEVVGIFVAQYAVVIGFVLLFAGLGTAWARGSAAESVIRRIPTRG